MEVTKAFSANAPRTVEREEWRHVPILMVRILPLVLRKTHLQTEPSCSVVSVMRRCC